MDPVRMDRSLKLPERRKFSPKRLGLFVAQFVGWLALFLLIFPFVLPIYEHAVLGPVNGLSKTMDPPTEYLHRGGGALAVEVVHPSGRRFPFSDKDFTPYSIFLSLPLFPALMLATPLAWRSRLKRLGIGMIAIYIIHIVALIWMVRGQICNQVATADGRETPFLCTWMYGLSLTSGQLGAILVWAAATWSFWLSQLFGDGEA